MTSYVGIVLKYSVTWEKNSKENVITKKCIELVTFKIKISKLQHLVKKFTNLFAKFLFQKCNFDIE